MVIDFYCLLWTNRSRKKIKIERDGEINDEK